MQTQLRDAPAGTIDAHTHIFPPDVCQDRDRYCQRDQWFGELFSSPRASLVSAEELIESMDQAGIERSVLCGWPWNDSELVEYHNDYLAEAASKYPDRLAWLAMAQPSDRKRLEQLLLKAAEDGASGVGEINADAQGFDLADTRMLASLADFCRQKGWPIMIHVSEPVGHGYPGKGTAIPSQFLRFIESNPELQIIAAHWGGGLPFYELMPEVREACRKVWYDSAASTYLYDFRVFQTVIDIVGPEKILFGSDFPVLRQDRFVRRVTNLDWKDESVLPMIMKQNAYELFGFSQKREVADDCRT